MSEAKRTPKAALDLVATLLMCAAAVAVGVNAVRSRTPTVRQTPSVPIPSRPLDFPIDTAMGSPAAPVAILEFSDFQCPFCADFVSTTWPSLKRKYIDTGQIKVGFRRLPLAIHDRAKPAAVIAACAASHGAFWSLHDELFADPTRLADSSLAGYAVRAGVPAAELKSCRATAEARVAQDSALAQSLGLSGTPAFLVGRAIGTNGVRVTGTLLGARPLSQFETEIRKALEST